MFQNSGVAREVDERRKEGRKERRKEGDSE